MSWDLKMKLGSTWRKIIDLIQSLLLLLVFFCSIGVARPQWIFVEIFIATFINFGPENSIMEAYGKILLIAMPAFLFFVLFEKFWGWYKGNDTVRNMDMISSLGSGVTNVTKDVLGLSISILTYGWLVDKVALVHLQTSIWTYVIAFITLDFAGYWVHRWSHHINIFWNLHVIHHS